jgi:hypothetical protein
MHPRQTHFDAQINASAQHCWYQMKEGVQGFTRSHWTSPSGEYSGCIVPDGQLRFECHEPWINDQKVPYLSAVLLALSVRQYVTERIARQRGSRAITEATGQRLWASMAADSRPSDIFSVFFFSSFFEFFHRRPAFKQVKMTSRPLIT